MPILAGLFASLFASLAGFFGAWLTKKAAFAAAAISVFALLTVGLMALIATSISAVLVLPGLPAAVAQGMRMFIPDNLPAVASVVIASDAAIALYRWNVENLKLASYIT